MSDELEVLKLVTERLEAAGFAYMVSGYLLASVANLDMDYLDRWANALGIAALLAEARS